jgi:hypothetical protein
MRIFLTTNERLQITPEPASLGGNTVGKREIHKSVHVTLACPAVLRRICNRAEIRAPPVYRRWFVERLAA